MTISFGQVLDCYNNKSTSTSTYNKSNDDKNNCYNNIMMLSNIGNHLKKRNNYRRIR